jgi:hypothetical protein
LGNPECAELVGETAEGLVDGRLSGDQRRIREEAGLFKKRM